MYVNRFRAVNALAAAVAANAILAKAQEGAKTAPRSTPATPEDAARFEAADAKRARKAARLILSGVRQ
ncbi:hypothetical protein NUJ30_08335 [Burkholderia contaminans]|uniref:hypothetical protein n=1 Tax=Burkholderia TaxID=32008 RepID=UPI0010F9D7E7|nr:MULTISPECIES: hypothetical protein [Burkholderia]MBD1412878.1 hypothetical protein [Burkholderia contaminans]UXZ68672.1 hypothetical protein NUJ29_08340 [Burkholderia contaminans]UXZ76433.1 hypothetical protein NUJ30_08335 [Burkholderia contaminans]